MALVRTLLAAATAALLSACVTIGDRDSAELEEAEAELLATQLSLVRTQINEGNVTSALNTIRPLVHRFPNSPRVLNTYGLTHLALKNPAQAARMFRRAYRLAPEPPFALNLSSALVAIGHYDKALAILRKLRKTDYRFPERVAHNIGLVYERQGETRKALAAYRKAQQENPGFYLSAIREGKIHLRQGRIGLARKRFEAATATCTICFEAVSDLATIYLNAEDASRAQKLLSRFLSHKDARVADKDKARALLRLAENLQRRLASTK